MGRILLILTLLLAGAAQAQLIPSRDQLTSRERLLGWEAVGRLDTGSGYCTATLIATDLVLTAAHCLYDRSGRPVPPGQITFRAGLRGDEAVAEGQVLRMVAHPGYDPAHGTHPASVRHDVALVQLRQPIAAAVAAPFPVRPLPMGRQVSVVSYARGRDTVLSWERACKVLGRQDGLMAVDCDLDFGSSGAPVFDLTQGRGQIVGLISAGRRQGDKAVALAMELPALVAALQQALRRGEGVAEAAPPPGARRVAVGTGDTGGARFLRPPPPKAP